MIVHSHGLTLMRAAAAASAPAQHAQVLSARLGMSLADGRTLRARQVVNAAGAWADAVGALAGAAPIGLEVVPGLGPHEDAQAVLLELQAVAQQGERERENRRLAPARRRLVAVEGDVTNRNAPFGVITMDVGVVNVP